MAKTSTLPFATLPLAGGETVPIVQGGVSKQVPAELLPVPAISKRSDIYDPVAEFTGGAQGAIFVPELQYLFTDLAGTIVATEADEGQIIRRWDARYTTNAAVYRGIQAIDARCPVLRRMGNLWYLDFANGKCMYLAANVPMECRGQILFAGSFDGVETRAFCGYVKNSGAAFYLASDSFERARIYIDGASDIARPFKIATTPDYSAPTGAIGIYIGANAPGSVSAKLENSLDKPSNSPIASAWQDGDVVNGMSFGINIGFEALDIGQPNADASAKCFGFMLINKKLFSNPDGVVDYYRQYTQIEMRPTDLSIFGLWDSTSDDESVLTEIAKYATINGLVVDNPTKDVFYRVWNRQADTYTGWQPLTPGNRAERIFVTIAASAGAQPSYFTANRFESISAIPHVNRRWSGHGHNLAVTELTSQNHPQAGLLRLGEFIEMEDQLRAKWPDAPVLMCKIHPVRIAGDNRTLPVNAAMQLAQDEIYHDIHFADIAGAFEAAGRNPALYIDDVHMSAAGVTLAGDTFINAYRAWVLPPKVTPPAISRRRIAAQEMVFDEGLLESWAGGLPERLGITGATVSRSAEQMLRGPSMKIVGAASGNSYVDLAFDPVPYQGKVVSLTVWQLIVEGSDFETGQIQAGSNGTGNVGNSWIYAPNKSFGTWEPRTLHLPLPNNATTAFFRIWAGLGATGTCYIDRAIPSQGLLPHDLLH